MESNKPKAMTDYERRKLTDERKKRQGLTKRAYFQNQADIDLVQTVKDQLKADGKNYTNDDAVAHIFGYYREKVINKR